MTSTTPALNAIGSPDGAHEVRDPATGEPIGRVEFSSPADVSAAVGRATAAQPAWAALPDAERVNVLARVADAIDANAEELATLLSREQGKPLDGMGARFELGGVSAWLRTALATPLPVETLVDDGQTHAELHYRPVGTVAVITPWNWPLMITTWQIAPALRMGNTVVAKPSEHTTMSSLALYRVMNEVLPPSVLEVVTGAGGIGDSLVRDARIGKVMFTGSTRTGRKIIEASAGNLARLTLELGGNDAGIVLDDVDAAAIAEGLFWGAFINTGQTCAALKRLYVPAGRYDEVVRALAEVAASIPMGNGLEAGNVLGPLQNSMQFDIVDRLVEDAKARGARIVVGGEPDRDQPGNFYPTTLVADIPNDADLVQQEQFGPALPIIKYDELEQAVAWANGVEVGLGGSVWSADREKALAVASRLEAGTVWINSHGGIDPRIPFGGVKGSGYGLEFGVEGLKSVAVPQVING